MRWTAGGPATRLKAKPSARDLASHSRIMRKASRVEKAHVAQIQRQLLEAGPLLLAEMGVDDRNGRHIQLPNGIDANRSPFGLDFAAERFDKRTGI